MTKQRIKAVSKDTLRTQLSEAMKDVHDANVRYKICHELFRQLAALEMIQVMPYEQRCVFWKCNYHLFDYLRTNGQLQREPSEFDEDVKEFLNKLFIDLEYKNLN